MDSSIVNNQGRTVRVAIWLLRIVFSLGFLFFSVMKLSGRPAMVAEFETVGLGQWFRYFTGTLELIGAVTIVVPRFSIVGAIVMLTVDLGALFAHLTVLGCDWIHAVIMAALLGVLICLERPGAGQQAS
ncbi:DoxX family protein [Massilia sp. 9096]|uniref:DoxX family protein n=1 Tax=Massilia sp. 9096 TaxID=1500894 RepID=UPI000564F39C|nr:DoxX family protein [Massilia sp. 9096]